MNLLSAKENARLAALRDFNVLDTPPEQAFDDLTQLAAYICQTPIATISLVDRQRQWFKSSVGLQVSETPRDISFCSHTILKKDQILEVNDALADPRFANSPLVTLDPRVRFYAGAPLITASGHAIGAVCVMDHSPRTLNPEQVRAMQMLSRQVVAQLELRQRAHELAARERDAAQMLKLAERSRRVLLGVLEDEKLAGQNLRESETRFRQLADNINEVFWLTDLEKKEMLYVSAAYERIWGRPCQTLYASASTWLDSVHPKDRPRVESTLPRQAAGNYDETYRIVRPDGEIRWVRDRAFPIRNEAGAIYRLAGVAEDITDHRRLEAQFQQAQKMEAIGSLAGGIAHDFNNILCGIIGFTELASRRASADKLTSDYLGSVLAAAQRAASLIEQILAFSRQQEYQRSLVQLRHVVAEPLKLLRATLPSTLRFETEFAHDLPPVLANATQIHQVVMNLCTNAAHAMRDRPGVLSVKLDNFLVDETFAKKDPHLSPGRYVSLTIADTGHGMDQATQQRIFEPFFTTKKAGEGTGLGLSVVHGIVRSHQGAIFVTSELGHGTTFQLLFPAKSGQSIEHRPKSQIPTGHGERVLFVDDEDSLLQLGKAILAELGYVTVTCSSGAAALKALETSGPFDLVITDLTMPEMTGIDLALRIQAIAPSLPVVLATGYANTEMSERIKSAGVREIMFKPHSIESLGKVTRRALDRAKKT